MPGQNCQTKVTGEICKRCNRRNVIGYEVSDKAWHMVSAGLYNVLCPTCFDELAEEKNIIYSFLAVYPTTWVESNHKFCEFHYFWEREKAPIATRLVEYFVVNGVKFENCPICPKCEKYLLFSWPKGELFPKVRDMCIADHRS